MQVDVFIDYVDITEDDGTPVVSWSQEEWMQDPETVVPAIANAIMLAYTDPDTLRNSLKKVNQ